MAGGDLCSALQRDMLQSERGGRRQLGWYGRGCHILLSIARGLAYLHEQRVRARPGLQCLAWRGGLWFARTLYPWGKRS